MSKIKAMREALSPEAVKALTLAGSANQGYVPNGHSVTPQVLAEFRIHGVVGYRDGLTMIGSLLAATLAEEMYDAAF